MRSGQLPATGQVVAEEHLSHHYGLRPGDTIELLGPTGWRSNAVSGSALSTEYFWPARSQQEILTTPEHFGVVFITGARPANCRPATDRPAAAIRARPARLGPAATAWPLTNGSNRVMSSRRTGRCRTMSMRSGTFAKLLPWVFLVAAVVGAYVLLSRLVAAQRAVIGTLSANGLSGSDGARSLPDLRYRGRNRRGGIGIGRWLCSGRLVHHAIHPGAGSSSARHFVASDQSDHRCRRRHAAAAVAAWAPARAASRMSPAEAMRISPPRRRGAVERDGTNSAATAALCRRAGA